MNISANGLHLIAGFEGYRPAWYDDGTGVQTIGYGHTGKLPKGFTAPLNPSRALDLLKADAQIAVDAVNAAIRVNLGIVPARKQARYDACYCLAFNIGGPGFASSTLVHEINQKSAPRNWTPLGPLWLEWDHADGAVLPGLLSRRKAEFAIFASGTYPKGSNV